MNGLQAGIVAVLFLAVLGCYIFQFNHGRHVTKEISELKAEFTKFCLEVTDRLARIETALEIEDKR